MFGHKKPRNRNKDKRVIAEKIMKLTKLLFEAGINDKPLSRKQISGLTGIPKATLQGYMYAMEDAWGDLFHSDIRQKRIKAATTNRYYNVNYWVHWLGDE